MWRTRLPGIRSGCPVGSHAWILIAMFQLAMDFSTCESVAQGQGFRLWQRPSHRHRLSHSPLWSFKNGQQLRILSPFWNQASFHPEWSDQQIQTYHSRRPHKTTDQFSGFLSKSMQSQRSTAAKSAPSIADGNKRSTEQQTHLKRGKRHLRESSFDHRDSRPTTLPEVIIWGPTGDEDSVETSTFPGNYGTTTTTTTATLQTRTTTVATTTTTTTSTTVQFKGFTASPGPGSKTHKNNPGRISTTEPHSIRSSDERDATAPKDNSGLAVHQIITITVSLIMVIAALITTLVLKNCCAQSGNPRRNSHQRKINQQEESCQNLTDFTPARVPSNLDIFTAYNETLQCSHECVRTAVPVYTEEALHSPGDYKTTFNGNRIPLVNL